MIDPVAGRLAATRVLMLGAAWALTACGSDAAPPMSGNLVDARGAHAGSFRGPGGSSNETATAAPANNQDAPR